MLRPSTTPVSYIFSRLSPRHEYDNRADICALTSGSRDGQGSEGGRDQEPAPLAGDCQPPECQSSACQSRLNADPREILIYAQDNLTHNREAHHADREAKIHQLEAIIDQKK